MGHVTQGQRSVTKFGTLTTFISLTETGKPVDPTVEPEHLLNGFCWCQPLVETDIVTGDHLFIHRRSVDSPHIEIEL